MFCGSLPVLIAQCGTQCVIAMQNRLQMFKQYTAQIVQLTVEGF